MLAAPKLWLPVGPTPPSSLRKFLRAKAIFFPSRSSAQLYPFRNHTEEVPFPSLFVRIRVILEFFNCKQETAPIIMLAAPKLWLPVGPTPASSLRKFLRAKEALLLQSRTMAKLPLVTRPAVTCRPDGIGGKFSKDLEQMAANFAATLVVSATVLSSALLVTDYANALDRERAGTLFQRSCVGCHVGGGNILQPGGTLTAGDLQRNGVADVDDIFKITYTGKGRMPGFGELCAPRGQCTFGPRLSDEDIRALAEFVRLQADQGWPNAR